MRRSIVTAVALLLVVSACGSADDAQDSAITTPAPSATDSTPTEPAPPEPQSPAVQDDGPPATASSGNCAASVAPTEWTSEVAATATRLIESGGLTVDAVVYPRPDYEGRPWSQWGQGIVLDDGRFLSGMGDHRGPDGNSYLFEFDPATGTMIRIADILSLADHEPGAWGYGKIHAQMVPGRCGDVLVTTYWGTRRDLEFSDTYRGDLLFRLDPASRTIDNLGVFFPEHGVPSLATDPASGLIYGEAVDPLAPRGGVGSFVVFDPAAGEVVFADDDDAHSGYRSIAVDADGRAYFSAGDGRLAVYDPAANAIEPFAADIPGRVLRAAAPPANDGTIFGVTNEPAVFFALDPAGAVRELGPARGYTTSIALSPDDSTIYYIPDAHGGSWQQGTPLVAIDTATGSEQVITELNPAAEQAMGLRLGGTYSVATDPSGSTLYIGMNAGAVEGDREAFGEVVLLVVTLP